MMSLRFRQRLPAVHDLCSMPARRLVVTRDVNRLELKYR